VQSLQKYARTQVLLLYPIILISNYVSLNELADSIPANNSSVINFKAAAATVTVYAAF
jgi:hypothetical protein